MHFQPLLLYFKSKQAQNLSHNKATIRTQYHAETWKQRPSENFLQSIEKGYLFCRLCPMPGAHSTWAWGTPDRSIKSWVTCIASCSRDIPCEIGTCWPPLHFFHIRITHYHCMAKQICTIIKYKMKPMQYAEIHALPYKYNVSLSTL